MADAQFLFPYETPPSSVEEKDRNGDGLQRFMDTVPFQDTEVLDSQMFETDGRELGLETYSVNEEESFEDMESDSKTEYEKAVVLDSEDEKVDGTKSVPTTGTRCFSYNKAGKLDNGCQMKSSKGQLKETCEEVPDETSNGRFSSGGRNSEQLSQCDYRPKSLNYTNSQEPDELSQANALDVVNKYVVHSLDLSPECHSERTVRGISSSISYVKGSYNLAKILRASNDEGNGIFSWSDNNQNDGAAGLFNKIETPSNHIGHNQSFEKKSGKHSHSQNCCKTSYSIRKGKKNLGSHTSRDVMQSQVEVKVSGQSNVMMNNSTNTSNEEFTKGQNFEPRVSTVDAVEMFDVGIGTQIAAEAMEALANIIPTEPLCSSGHGSPGGITKNDVLLQPSSMRENSNLQVFTSRPRRENVMHDELVRTVSTSSQHRLKKQKSIPNMKGTRMKEGNLSHGTMLVVATKKSSTDKEQKKSKFITRKSSLTESKDINCGPICTEHISHEGPQSDEYLWHSPTTLHYKQEPRHCQDMMDGANAMEQGMIIYKRRRRNLASDQDRQSQKIKFPRSPSSLFGIARTINSNQQSSHCQDVVDGALERAFIIYTRKRRNLTSDQVRQSPKIKFPRSPSSSFEIAKAISSNPQVQGSLQDDATMSCFTLSLRNHPKGPRGKRRRLNVPSIQNEDTRERYPGDFRELPGKQVSSFGQGVVGSIDKDIYVSHIADKVRSIEDCKFSSFQKTCYDHPKTACNKNSPKSSLMKELTQLGVHNLESNLSWKSMRQRRAMAGVRVLFSQHLDKNIIRQQKKILTRLNISIASSAIDATHFVADKFVRTRNMLESIALGKTVVTHQWLESCRLSHSLVDERNYILRDARKEKELGFSMPVTLSRARMLPLLKGKKVFVTPNIEPSKDMITSLVAALHGKVLDMCFISAMDEQNLENLLVLSCEQDYAICQPLLNIGVAVCSSELILNGIVTQKLELKRHQLFVNDVSRKCCSTLIGICHDGSIRSRLFGTVYSRRRKPVSNAIKL